MAGWFKKKKTEESADEQAAPRVSVWALFASVLSGVLLALSYPGYGFQELAFIALVPLMYAVQAAVPRRAAFLGWLGGSTFFLVSLAWLHNLTGTVEGFLFQSGCLIAYVLLCLLCGLYFIPLALMVPACIRRWGVQKIRTNLLTMLCITTTWVGAEYLRSILFTGFPWNFLGVSQYSNLSLIQMADWGGVYAVSAIIIWFSAAAFLTLMQYTHGGRARKYRAHLELMAGILPIAVTLAYGFNILLNQPEPTEPAVRIALVQPNIPQSQKWDKAMESTIYKRLDELTDAAVHLGQLDLIIWPETALPDLLRVSEASSDLVRKYTQNGVPLLTGTLDVDVEVSPPAYFNSSFLIGTNGILLAKYDKQHLVPFGEYMPLPMIRKYTPIALDITPGTESTLFQLPGIPAFSTLICFEDIVAPLASKAVRNGARWLVNQTNDGWFDPSAQSEQHLSQAVFRCVENRVPMVRSGNTGISCTIDIYGGVGRGLRAQTEGFATVELHPAAADHPLTFYARYGDLFAKANLLFALLSAIALRFVGRK